MTLEKSLAERNKVLESLKRKSENLKSERKSTDNEEPEEPPKKNRCMKWIPSCHWIWCPRICKSKNKLKPEAEKTDPKQKPYSEMTPEEKRQRIR